MDGTGPQNISDNIDQWNAAEYLRKRVPQAQYSRRAIDRTFYRNVLFYVGLQWLRYSRSNQQWRPISLPDWFPKQITNKYAVCCDLMKSVFMQSDPVSLFQPATSEPEDLAAARAAADISKMIEVCVDQSSLESQVASWLAITGNAFVIDGYDNDKRNGTKFLPDFMCLSCARHVPSEESEHGCPYCGSNNLLEAKDEDGSTIGRDVPIGKMYSEVASPFEMHFDLVGDPGEQHWPYIYRARTYPIELLKDMFPEHADDIKSDDAGIDSGMFYQTALAYITNGAASSPGNYGGSVGSIDNVPRATLYHLWVNPTNKLPRGGEALVTGGKELWKSELSFHDENDNPIVPVTHFGFNRVPGRLISKSPADDLVYKQVQRNKIESFLTLSLERNANGTWLLPKSIGIDAISGEPGEKIWYNAFGNVKPERVPGLDVPGSVFRWMQTIDMDMHEISHTDEVMRGKTPQGVPTFGGTQLLLERAFAGYSDALKSWGRGWNRVRRNRLLIAREYWDEEQTMMVLGENREWEAKKFSKDSIKGHINVYLDEGTIAPQSKGYKQLMVSQLIQNQLIDLQDPLVRSTILNLYDAEDLLGSLDTDILDAVKEKEEFVKSSQLRPRKGIDNDMIHSLEHKKVAKSDDFKHWPVPMQAKWIQHIFYHDQIIAQQAQQAQQNDPHVLNAKARLDQIEMELNAFMKTKDIELQHKQASKTVDLQAHGVKKGMDAVLAAKQAALKSQQNNGFRT